MIATCGLNRRQRVRAGNRGNVAPGGVRGLNPHKAALPGPHGAFARWIAKLNTKSPRLTLSPLSGGRGIKSSEGCITWTAYGLMRRFFVCRRRFECSNENQIYQTAYRTSFLGSRAPQERGIIFREARA